MALSVYDMEFCIPDLYYIIKDEISFMEDLKDCRTFHLIGTDFYVTIQHDYCVWYEFSKEETAQISFEYVLDNSPEHIQEKLLFYLNIFC